jgi:hypothetical protein
MQKHAAAGVGNVSVGIDGVKVNTLALILALVDILVPLLRRPRCSTEPNHIRNLVHLIKLTNASSVALDCAREQVRFSKGNNRTKSSVPEARKSSAGLSRLLLNALQVSQLEEYRT